MLDVAVIEDPAAAEASLDPIRARLLAELAEPGTATLLAAKIGLPRQKVNYHLRTLERHGLVELVEERRKGNVTERVVQASAAAFVISPAALGSAQPDPQHQPDQLSARWLIAIAGRTLREVGALVQGAAAARKRVATFTVDADVRFASAADRSAFAGELADTISTLVQKYHSEQAPAGRAHRVVLAIHPATPAGTEKPGTDKPDTEKDD